MANEEMEIVGEKNDFHARFAVFPGNTQGRKSFSKFTVEFISKFASAYQMRHVSAGNQAPSIYFNVCREVILDARLLKDVSLNQSRNTRLTLSTSKRAVFWTSTRGL